MRLPTPVQLLYGLLANVPVAIRKIFAGYGGRFEGAKTGGQSPGIATPCTLGQGNLTRHSTIDHSCSVVRNEKEGREGASKT